MNLGLPYFGAGGVGNNDDDAPSVGAHDVGAYGAGAPTAGAFSVGAPSVSALDAGAHVVGAHNFSAHGKTPGVCSLHQSNTFKKYEREMHWLSPLLN